MKAIGRNLIIKKEKVGTAKTKGGLLLAEKQRDDIRYILADVISVGDEATGIKTNDKIYYDKHAGHGIEFEKEKYQVIKIQDVVVVL
ncbi:MAG: co-chaperone GroES [Colwellia sp.]|nr:co-chaperone GroES [Colwellia sp.]